MLDIKIIKTEHPKEKPAKGQPLGFGKIFTDHMFVMNYTEGKGWHDPRVEPFHNISLSPAAMVYHYGQEMFEGLKAYKNEDGEVYLFRPDMNAKRTNATNDRLVIPQIPVEDFVQAVKAVVDVDRDWIPTDPGTSLYIRPFIIATDEFLGVAPSKTYLFMVILSPSGAYYESGLAPVGSPIITAPDVLIAMNLPSLQKYVNAVVPGGQIYLDSTLIDAKVERTDVEVFYIPATQLAKDAGFATLANMVLMGKVMKETDAVSFENNKATFEAFIPAKKANLIDVNCQALQTGYDYEA